MSVRKKIIYLDTAAATPTDRAVARRQHDLRRQFFGNAGSLHRPGVLAATLLTEARLSVARFLDAHPDEIVFTSGGTEANNLALAGLAKGLLKTEILKKPGHIITSIIEHPSVLEPIEELKRGGWPVTILPVGESGVVQPQMLRAALRPDTAIVSIMLANNEIGTLQPVKEIAKIVRAWRKKSERPYPYFHVDACQATRFLDLKMPALGVDLLTINSNKVYGPKGVGALFVRRGVPLAPIILGGGQENGKRAGTENVPALSAFAQALVLAAKNRKSESRKLTVLRDYFIKKLKNKISTGVVNGMGEKLPDIINFSLPGLSGEQVVIELDAKGIAVSTGSACSARDRDLSYVVFAVTGSPERATEAVRVSLGRTTTRPELDYLIECLVAIRAKYKKVNSLLI